MGRPGAFGLDSYTDPMSDMAVATETPVHVEPDESAPTGAAISTGQLGVVVSTLVLYVAVISFMSWPGHMNIDTIGQIEEMRTGRITDWHAGLLLYFWRPFWRLGYGIGWAFATTLLAFVFGVYSILRVRLGRLAAVIGTDS